MCQRELFLLGLVVPRPLTQRHCDQVRLFVACGDLSTGCLYHRLSTGSRTLCHYGACYCLLGLRVVVSVLQD